MEYKLTIVMPSYNRGEYIKEAIESVLMQEVDFNYRLIIADDASTDNSLEIALEYKRKYPEKIEVLPSEKNQGLLANCLRIYRNMKTPYFCVVDADDYWTDRHHLKNAIDFLESNPDYTIYGANTQILRNGIIEDRMYHHECENEMTVTSIEDFFDGKEKYATNTLETIFRNVVFCDGVPEMIEESVGTYSESSFRGDTDRYMLHLKYGQAKFVNTPVCVYRIHDKGIWSSATEFHRQIMAARSHRDHKRYYDGRGEKFFEKAALFSLALAKKEFVNAIIEDRVCEIKDDLENYMELIGNYQPQKIKEYGYDNTGIDFLRNRATRKIVVWGTGAAAMRLIEKYFSVDEIYCFIDNNEGKQGTYVENKKVYAPSMLKATQGQVYVVIASSYYNEIIQQILQNNLCEESSIVNLYKFDNKLSMMF